MENKDKNKKENTRDILSEGITSDFFIKWNDVLLEAIKKEGEFRRPLDNKSNIEKYLDYNKKIFENISIYYRISGSKRNPIINFIYIRPRTLLDTNLFGNERCISIEACCIPVRQRNQWPSITPLTVDFNCPISKHAISRIIFRLGLKKLVFERHYDIFFKQFNYVPIISQFYVFIFWLLNIFEIILSDDIKGISIIIPTENGLLLGGLDYRPNSNDKNRRSLRPFIRTFIDDDILKGEEQAHVKDILCKIFSESSEILGNPFLSPTATTTNAETIKNMFGHGIFYFIKLMEIKDDLLYLMSRKDNKFDDTVYFRLNKAFDKLDKIFQKLKIECGIKNNATIDEIYEKFDVDVLNQFQ